MRLKAEIWVQAYIRSCNAAGAPAMLVRRGDRDAGAIYIKVSRLDGTAELYGPAAAGLEETGSGRLWERCLGSGPVSEEEITAYLAKASRFDPDLWLIEVEDRKGRHFLDDWLAQQ